MNDTDVDIFLSHYGVKGMKWGVRKDRDGRSRQQRLGSSKDAKKAQRTLDKAKRSGVTSLTNEELKDLNKRLELEKKYSDIAPSKYKKGENFFKRTMGLGDMANQAIRFLNSPAGKIVASGLVFGAGVASTRAADNVADRFTKSTFELLK